MLSRRRRRKNVRRALADLNLRRALDRASRLQTEKFDRLTGEIPWEEAKKKAREIREKNVAQLPRLIERFSREAEKSGAFVHRVVEPREALELVVRIAREKKAKLVVKSKSMVSEEIGLNRFLEEKGFEVIETDLGEWIIQLAGERPSHITAPALHKTKKEVAELLTRRLGRPVAAEAKDIVRAAREEMRRHFLRADIGITGANFAVAESGTLVIVSNEGNARLVSTLPPVHIALVTAEKFVETLEEATTLIKVLTAASAGRKLTSYVSFITGPSSTTDIEKELITGVHGPGELHIIILDNGRLALSESEDFHEILYCLKCGGCMFVCPVFRSVGGHVFGGPVYPGGIGTLLTAMTDSVEEAAPILSFCADCKKCETFCPVGIPTGELLVKIKAARGPTAAEKALSSLFRKKKALEAGARFVARIQGLWRKNDHFRALPVIGWKGRRLPLLKPRKAGIAVRGGDRKAYLFEGCMARLFFPEVRRAACRVLGRIGYTVAAPESQVCCGAPSLHLGDEEAVRDLAARNLRSFEEENPDVIVTVCPTGYRLLKHHYPGLDARAIRWSERVVDFTSLIVSSGKIPLRAGSAPTGPIYYHSPCHSLCQPELAEKPKELLERLGIGIAKTAGRSSCCGFGGVFSFRQPDISARLWEEKKAEIVESGASLVATDCPGCLFQIRSEFAEDKSPVRSLHIAELLDELISQEKRTTEEAGLSDCGS